MLTLEYIQQAALRLDGITAVTPLLESPRLNRQFNARILFKAECLQITGSFKLRGATNCIASLSEQQRQRGVVAYSSGNHAQGVAAAAARLGMDATIVMPRDAPAIKQRNTREYGAHVVLYDRATQDREQIGVEIATDQGASIIPPYDDYRTMAGQGTVGLEIIQQLQKKDLQADLLLCPAGGGGLIAGISTVFAARSPATRIFSVEPENFDDTRRSLEAGKRIANDAGDTSICDAIVTPMPGELTFEINKQTLSGGLAVTEQLVARAMCKAFDELKLVVEPGGAVGLAAILSAALDFKDKTVVVILSGGNVDPNGFCELTGNS